MSWCGEKGESQESPACRAGEDVKSGSRAAGALRSGVPQLHRPRQVIVSPAARRPRMCRVRNKMLRCPGVSLWLRQARVAGVARVRPERGSHRAAARGGGKPGRYALACGLLLMMLVLSPMAGRLQGTDAAGEAPWFPVADPQGAPRSRPGRHLQPLSLRGRARRQRGRPGPSGDHREAL